MINEGREEQEEEVPAVPTQISSALTHIIHHAGREASRGVERQGDNSVCITSQRTHSTQLVTAGPAGPRTHPSPPSEIEHEGSKRERRLTTGYRYSQSPYEFSLPLAFLTTGSSNSHYCLLFSLPELRILTTACCCHYQSFEFSLPLAVLTTDPAQKGRGGNRATLTINS